MKKLKENFEEIETTKEYDGYYYEAAEVISIEVLGSLCGLKNRKQVHQWATNERTREFLRKEQGIERILCYYWFLCLLKLVKPESLNRCPKKWAERQCSHLTADRTAQKNSLIAILVMTYPGANELFTSPARGDGTQKWVGFVRTFWHLDCVRDISLAALAEHYPKWDKKRKYNFSCGKAAQIHADAQD